MSLLAAGTLAAATAAAAVALLVPLRGVALTGARVPHPEAASLADAGWQGGIVGWEAARCGAIAACGVAAIALGLPLALAAAAAAAPSVWIRFRAEAARDRARRAFGRILAMTESGSRAGLSLPEALRRAADAVGDPLASRPLLETLRAFDLGASLDAALTLAAGRTADEHARVALGSIAVGVAEQLPRERLADLVASVAERAEFEQRLADEVRARAAGARQQQSLLAVVVPAIAAYLALTMPALASTLGSDLGRFVLIPAAACLELGGILIGRRIVRAVAA